MAKQHVTPVLVPVAGVAAPLVPLSQRGGEGAVSEDWIQELIHHHPTCLPIEEIDPIFASPVPICRELKTPAGSIDNLMVTSSGLPVLIECKLWRNAEARREVVGQILDYAKELARLTPATLDQLVRGNLGGRTSLFEIVRRRHPEIDQTQFHDALSSNLRRGRFLLLIVGDGIREGVAVIADYLLAHAGLHFSLGLVELPIYLLPDGSKLVAPRVLAQTHVLRREVIAVPPGYVVHDPEQRESEQEADPEISALGSARQQFWTEFLEQLRLDDPEQPIPKPPRQGYLGFTLPAPSGSSWLTVYRDMKSNEVGVFLSSNRNTAGEYAMRVIAEDWANLHPLLGGTATLTTKDDRPRIGDAIVLGDLNQPGPRTEAIRWLAERVNTFVNLLRPRVRSAVADYRESGSEA